MNYRYGGEIKPGDLVLVPAHRKTEEAEAYLQEATVTLVDEERKTVQVERHDNKRRVYKYPENLRLVRRGSPDWKPGPPAHA